MTAPTTVEMARATAGDVATIGETLARAFHGDPVFRWIVSDDDARRAQLPAVFAAFADVYVPLGETYRTRDGAGAAMWAPAGADPFTEEQAEAFGERMIAALGDNAERAGLLEQLLEEQQPEEPCLYLQFVGVVPERQGGGLGSRLLETVLERADATATPAYLDATSPDNRRLYERHGFATVAELALPDGPPMWSMWREPRASVDGEQ